MEDIVVWGNSSCSIRATSMQSNLAIVPQKCGVVIQTALKLQDNGVAEVCDIARMEPVLCSGQGNLE